MFNISRLFGEQYFIMAIFLFVLQRTIHQLFLTAYLTHVFGRACCANWQRSKVFSCYCSSGTIIPLPFERRRELLRCPLYCSSGSENYHASPSINGSKFSAITPRTIKNEAWHPYRSSGARTTPLPSLLFERERELSGQV